MVATSVHYERATQALIRVRDIVEEYGSDAQIERLSRIRGRDEFQGKILVPPPKFEVEFATFQAEALLTAFEMLAQIKEAQKPKPKRGRGRPPKKRPDEAA